MSNLPATNGEAAQEWIRRAAWRYGTGVRVLEETVDTKEAVRDFASAAELAIKAVYIKHEMFHPRTHSVGKLLQGCPDPTVWQALEGYSEGFVKAFSQHYLAPYVLAQPVPLEDVERCRSFAERIVEWAEGVIRETDP